MSHNRTPPADLQEKILETLKERFNTEFTISSFTYLSEPERRNVLARIEVQSVLDSAPTSIILKQSLPRDRDADNKDAYARFARDWAGLEFASKLQQTVHNAPRFYCGNKEKQFILIEDLGREHVSLVNSLVLPDRAKAVSALERYMKALGSFQAASFNHTDEHERILRGINKDAATPQQDLEGTSKYLLEKFALANETLGLAVTADLRVEVQQVLESIFKPGPFTVLAHGDIAPDNVFDHEGAEGLQLIDFEMSSARNALLDGTYLRMSIPTGWCAKEIPEELRKQVEQIYRDELKKTIPAAADDKAYTAAYTLACGFHALHQLALLNSILEKDAVWDSGPVPKNSLWKAETNLYRPRFLSRLQAFIDVASENKLLPNLRDMAEKMLAKVKVLWPDAKPLELYPAFGQASLESKQDQGPNSSQRSSRSFVIGTQTTTPDYPRAAQNNTAKSPAAEEENEKSSIRPKSPLDGLKPKGWD